MSNTELFSGKADVYASSRPGYPDELVEYLLSEISCPNPIIADIGSGTGIFTESLLKAGVEVFAVEPNNEMRFAAEKNLGAVPNFHSVFATAENTGLNAKSFDMVTAATAFHWFDTDKFREECRRILKNNAKTALIYNHQPESNFTYERHLVLEKYCSQRKGFNQGSDYMPKIEKFYRGQYDVKRFPNDLRWNESAFINRCLSSSFALSSADGRFDDYIADLKVLFFKHAIDGNLVVANEAIVYIGVL